MSAGEGPATLAGVAPLLENGVDVVHEEVVLIVGIRRPVCPLASVGAV